MKKDVLCGGGGNEIKWAVEERKIYKAKCIRTSNRIVIITGYVLMLCHSTLFI